MTEKEIKQLVQRATEEGREAMREGGYELSFLVGWLQGVLEREIKKPGSTAKLY